MALTNAHSDINAVNAGVLCARFDKRQTLGQDPDLYYLKESQTHYTPLVHKNHASKNYHNGGDILVIGDAWGFSHDLSSYMKTTEEFLDKMEAPYGQILGFSGTRGNTAVNLHHMYDDDRHAYGLANMIMQRYLLEDGTGKDGQWVIKLDAMQQLQAIVGYSEGDEITRRAVEIITENITGQIAIDNGLRTMDERLSLIPLSAKVALRQADGSLLQRDEQREAFLDGYAEVMQRSSILSAGGVGRSIIELDEHGQQTASSAFLLKLFPSTMRLVMTGDNIIAAFGHQSNGEGPHAEHPITHELREEYHIRDRYESVKIPTDISVENKYQHFLKHYFSAAAKHPRVQEWVEKFWTSPKWQEMRQSPDYCADMADARDDAARMFMQAKKSITTTELIDAAKKGESVDQLTIRCDNPMHAQEVMLRVMNVAMAYLDRPAFAQHYGWPTFEYVNGIRQVIQHSDNPEFRAVLRQDLDRILAPIDLHRPRDELLTAMVLSDDGCSLTIDRAYLRGIGNDALQIDRAIETALREQLQFGVNIDASHISRQLISNNASPPDVADVAITSPTAEQIQQVVTLLNECHAARYQVLHSQSDKPETLLSELLQSEMMGQALQDLRELVGEITKTVLTVTAAESPNSLDTRYADRLVAQLSSVTAVQSYLQANQSPPAR